MRQSQQRGHFQSIACRVVGLSRQTVSEPFFASPAGALRPSGPSWRRRPSLSREAPPARPTMRFTSEDASHAAWLVAEQLLQGCPKISPPSTSPSVSTPGIRGRSAPPAREIPRSSEPSASGSSALRTFRPRGFAPPRRLAPPTARRLVASCYRPWGSSGFCASPSADWPLTLPLRCNTLQSLSTCKAASLSPGTVTFLPFQVCVPALWGTCRLQGLAPCKRP